MLRQYPSFFLPPFGFGAKIISISPSHESAIWKRATFERWRCVLRMLGARTTGRVRAHVHRDHLLRSSALSGMQSALWHQSLFQARPRFARLARATHELDWVAAKMVAGGWSRD